MAQNENKFFFKTAESNAAEEYANRTGQSNLPPKKRFDWKESGKDGKDTENEGSKTEDSRTVLPGVIRHTSCPDTNLAYYYTHSANNNSQ